MVVASGILSIWTTTPAAVAAEHARLCADYGDRFLLGLGVSHADLVEQLVPGAQGAPTPTTCRWHTRAEDACGEDGSEGAGAAAQAPDLGRALHVYGVVVAGAGAIDGAERRGHHAGELGVGRGGAGDRHRLFEQGVG